MRIDLFTDTAAILNSIVSNSYYGMLRGQISTYLPPEHPIIDIWNNRIQNGRCIGKKVYCFRHSDEHHFNDCFVSKTQGGPVGWCLVRWCCIFTGKVLLKYVSPQRRVTRHQRVVRQSTVANCWQVDWDLPAANIVSSVFYMLYCLKKSVTWIRWIFQL